MMRQITQVNWRYIGDVLPSFVVMMFIPFSYSVAYGLMACVIPSQLTTTYITEANECPNSGIFVYAVLNGLIGIVVYVSGGRVEPAEYDLKEYWTWKTAGRAPWFIRCAQGNNGGESNRDVPDTAHDNVLDSQGSILGARAKCPSKDYSIAAA